MAMLSKTERDVFTVVAHDGGWAVEHGGVYLDPSLRREDAVASASRRARAAFAQGRLVQIL